MLQGPLWPCPREEAQEVGRHPCPMVLLPHSPGSMVQPLNTEAKALPQCNLFLMKKGAGFNKTQSSTSVHGGDGQC